MWRACLALWLLFNPPLSHATVVLNEISPRTDPEWVELYNTGPDPVDLTNWYFLDLVSNQKIIASPSAFPANTYYLFTTSSGWLNNTGTESLTLYSSSGTAIDSVTFATTDPDTSIARVPDLTGSWYLSQVPTQLSPNPTPAPSPSPSPSPTSSLPSPSSAVAQTPTPTPTPTPAPSPSPSSSPSPKPLPTASPPASPSPLLSDSSVGTVAGEAIQIDLSIFSLSPVPSIDPSPTPRPTLNPTRAKTTLFVGAGLLLLALSSYFGLRHYHPKLKSDV